MVERIACGGVFQISYLSLGEGGIGLNGEKARQEDLFRNNFLIVIFPWDLRLRNGGLFHQLKLSCGQASHPESVSTQKPYHSAIMCLVDKKNLPIQNVISLRWSTVCIDEIKDIPMGNCLISKILIFRSYFTSSIFLHRSAIDGSESDRVLEYI